MEMKEPAPYVPLAVDEVTLLTTVPAEPTVSVAVLLTVPAVGVCVVVTPEVVFGCVPKVLLVTLNVTVQLLFGAIMMPEKLRVVCPAVNEDGVVPAQVPPTAPADALMFTSVSENAPPVSANALLLVNVRI